MGKLADLASAVAFSMMDGGGKMISRAILPMDFVKLAFVKQWNRG
jgi:hypothetical protein